ncbi:MAG: NINE protein [Saprospiraceae bacterium]
MDISYQMKDKNTAGVLALILGFTGAHWFYLGKKEYGFAQIILTFAAAPISVLVMMVTAFYFFGMDPEKFHAKFSQGLNADRPPFRRFRGETPDYHKKWQERTFSKPRPASRPASRPNPSSSWVQKQHLRKQMQKAAPYKKDGIKLFKDYDYPAAIEKFETALNFDPGDPATHFNLACAYSLIEEKDKSFYHLDLAIANGFNDFHKIKTHDALAYLRIQDEFDTFESNNYRLPPPETPDSTENNSNQTNQTENSEGNLLDSQPDLLDQLKKLEELKESGLLPLEQFEIEKKKLLG